MNWISGIFTFVMLVLKLIVTLVESRNSPEARRARALKDVDDFARSLGKAQGGEDEVSKKISDLLREHKARN